MTRSGGMSGCYHVLQVSEHHGATLASLLSVCPEVLWSGLHTPVTATEWPGRRELDVVHGPGCPTLSQAQLCQWTWRQWDAAQSCCAVTDLKAKFILYQLLRCVDALHEKGLHHGNITPANVMLTPGV